MVEIKGSQLINLVTSIKTAFGEDGYLRILEEMSPANREIFEQQALLASKWYPFDAYIEMLKLDVALFHHGDGTELIPPAEENIDKQLRGMYRVFVRLSSPSSIVGKVDDINRAFFQGITGSSKLTGPNTFVSTFIGFEPRHAVFENIMIAFFRKALDISGAKNVHVVFTTPISQGAPVAELTVDWD